MKGLSFLVTVLICGISTLKITIIIIIFNFKKNWYKVVFFLVAS